MQFDRNPAWLHAIVTTLKRTTRKFTRRTLILNCFRKRPNVPESAVRESHYESPNSPLKTKPPVA
ncbi:hypothetical protein SAMN06265222_11594 [Neorhodopirellula lusitana]|uniref:Uncharacterized protein n=1 Tax=Neorhodopirellula lusitana TaxID=445327 RepID=A0ABY1QMU9_9BACT|nr:hypothetical protein SAMN06265222_11594 [Neorhodopirellula lusitana]